MPNFLAYLMLLAWPLIAMGIFRALPPERALIWSILGAYLILPPLANFDFPLVPPLDKTSIPSLVAFLCCVGMLGAKVRLLPESLAGRVFVVMLVVGPLASALTNGDPILFGDGTSLRGVGAVEGLSSTVGAVIELMPFLLGRALLRSDRAMYEIVLALMLAGLAYSIPMLIEIRLSPQINVWVYGFFQHDFIQMMRAGGYRPMVFLPHGLWVAFFTLMALVAATALWRHGEPRLRVRNAAATAYLGVMLVLCKSMGALLFGMVLVPVARFLGLRWQLRLAAAVALCTVIYPLLRGAELVPLQAVVAQAEAVSVDRADSLRFRLRNEEDLLARAAEKPFFGWGPWGRNQIYDPATGDQTSTTDGLWVAVIGSGGWFGYIARYGLLALPTVLLWRASRRGVVSPYAATLSLIVAFNLADTLPNATLIAFSWLMCGALLGYAEALVRRPAPVPAEPAAASEPMSLPGAAEPSRTIL